MIPRWPLRFFRWYCNPDYLEDLEGDLVERFDQRLKEKGSRSAKLNFAIDVIRLFRPGIIRPSNKNYADSSMVKINIIIAYRNLIKDRVFSALNVLGLAIGICVSIVILKYVDFESSYDRFHEKSDNLYRLVADVGESDIVKTTLTHPPLGPSLQANFNEVIDYTRMTLPWSGKEATSTLSWKNPESNVIKHSFQWGFYTDPGFLRMFSFPMIRGDRKTALSGTNKIILSESSARKLFGNEWNENIIGQTIEYVNEFDRFSLTVTGVIEDAPENSHFQYDFLASFSTLSTGWGKGYAGAWNGNHVYTYVELSEGASTSRLENGAKNSLLQHVGDESPNTNYTLQPISEIYLSSNRAEELKVNANPTYLAFLFFIAIATILIAIINYVNLTTANALKRGREVGIRKVLGAQRRQLIRQILTESVLINGMAILIALILLLFITPSMEQLTDKTIDYFSIELWLFLLLVFPISSLLSGFYPALVLSGYQPLKTLKGKIAHSKGGIYLRKYLVVFQFWVSIGLIIFTFTIQRQLNYMRYSDTGFQKEGVLVVNGPVNRDKTWIEHDEQKQNIQKEDIFKSELSRYTGIESVSLSWSIPGENSNAWPIELGSEYENSKLNVINADSEYAQVYDLELIAGEFNTKDGVVINEKAALILGINDFSSSIGRTFKDARGLTYSIKGIVKDYYHYSLNEPLSAIIFQENDPSYKLDSYYSLKLTPENLQDKLTSIERAFEQAYPNNPFDYYFLDDFFNAQYESDIRFGKLFGSFSLLTIFIAILGLIGLAMHTVNIRKSEIGIRKMLGASVKNIVALLTTNTLFLVGLSCLFALPLSYWMAESWLSNYAFRIEVDWVFILPAIIIPIIVLLAISILSVKAAKLNPIDTLKEE